MAARGGVDKAELENIVETDEVEMMGGVIEKAKDMEIMGKVRRV